MAFSESAKRAWGVATAVLVIGATACTPRSRDALVGSSARAIAGSEARPWSWIQSVGGLRVLDPIRLADGTVLLPVACDVSGLHAITVQPQAINSALVVTRTEVAVHGDRIRVHIETGLGGERGITSLAPPATLVAMSPGTYVVEYGNPDGSTIELGDVGIPPPPASPPGPVTTASWLAVDGSWLRSRIARSATLLDDARQVFGNWPADARPFSPSPDEVRRAERRVVQTLLEACWAPDVPLTDLASSRRAFALEEIPKIVAHLGFYSAEVFGLETGGHRRVVFNVYAGGNAAPDGGWTVVHDGGYCFWRIEYDLDLNRCLGFDSNGYA